MVTRVSYLLQGPDPDPVADADGEEEDGDQTGAGDQLHPDVSHLPTDHQMIHLFAKKYKGSGQRRGERAWPCGGVHQGRPSDPSKSTPCAYRQCDLPMPDLGALPRDDVFEELRSDPMRLVKQRRDAGFPKPDVVSWR